MPVEYVDGKRPSADDRLFDPALLEFMMNRSTYFTPDVSQFTDWLSCVLGGAPVQFNAPAAMPYQHLHDALAAYQWPPRSKHPLAVAVPGFPYFHPQLNSLAADSDFRANAALLSDLQRALRASFASGSAQSQELAGAVAATLHWGGVYTSRSNKGWLLRNHAQLHSLMNHFVVDHAVGDDVSNIVGLRFNSGMTKVYALLLQDFIIYDSRVAGALAWLALQWWTVYQKQPAATLPSALKFGCLIGNGSKARYRNPCPAVFPWLRNSPFDHYTWNVRANWILASAQNRAGAGSRFADLREIEAALFQMGDRVC
ncbi:hypothetical protein [Pseudomonas sp. TE3610]